MIEKTVEEKLVEEVKKLGGLCYKFTSPGNIGVPDRIVVLNGKTVFVELKKPEGGRFSKMQEYQIRRIHENGGIVVRIKNYEEVDKFIEVIQQKGWKQ